MKTIAVESAPMNNSAHTALAIYIVIGHDDGDALEMIQACQDRKALRQLQRLLTATDNPDQPLNDLFVDPVRQRLAQLGGPEDESL